MPASAGPLSGMLDEAAAWAFGDGPGLERLQSSLDRWDEEVGHVREDDALRELLQAVRSDWALCDVLSEDGRPWISRLVAGDLGAVPDAWSALLRNHVGLFEVYPGKVSWLRDLRGGLCVPVLDPLPLPAEPDGPAALWEVRVVLRDGAAQLARPPLSYPMELLEDFRSRSRSRFGAAQPKLRWPALRRGWLQYSRARRADPRVLFRL